MRLLPALLLGAKNGLTFGAVPDGGYHIAGHGQCYGGAATVDNNHISCYGFDSWWHGMPHWAFAHGICIPATLGR